jgi:serine/threonine-protein phosphatase 6 regulatory ankyrin repeat subunit B
MGDIFGAVEEGNEGEVMRLLDADPALLEREDDGDRPLAMAAWNGHLGVVTLLVERGANIHASGYEGNTAMHYAATMGHEEVLALLLEKGAQANTRNDSGMTPLMGACDNVHLGVVELLLQHMRGQGLDERNDNGWTALHYAACWGHEEVVRFLLLAGADPTITDNWGRTPRAIQIAEENRDMETIRERRARCVAVFEVRSLMC